MKYFKIENKKIVEAIDTDIYTPTSLEGYTEVSEGVWKQRLNNSSLDLYNEGVLSVSEKPALTKEQVEAKRQSEYRSKVDPITAELTRLIQEDIEAERILELKAQREQIVDKIKEENPYPIEK